MEEGVLVCRPSTRNRSPYVGDVMLTTGPHAGRTAVTHLPNLAGRLARRVFFKTLSLDSRTCTSTSSAPTVYRTPAAALSLSLFAAAAAAAAATTTTTAGWYAYTYVDSYLKKL